MDMRRRLFDAVRRLALWLRPKPDQSRTVAALEGVVKSLSKTVAEFRSAEQQRLESFLEMIGEMAEAKRMAGAGPWQTSPAVITQTNALLKTAVEAFQGEALALKETTTPLPVAQGAYGDIELALQNVEWRREINLSWYEFSRWGIQQIMLISRLYYIKNPIIRRLIDVASVYVFGRGVEVTSSDPDANDVLKDFFERNQSVLGQVALCQLERQKYYDGNLFFAFFADTKDKGTVNVRTIDATEIQEIVSNPQDSDEPWYYKRQWVQRNFDVTEGSSSTEQMEAWYPALGYDPKSKPDTINGKPVNWDSPLYHRKFGNVGKWKFGCPIIYPALAWAKSATKFLEACATVKQSLAQFSMMLTTKGGQQAIEGAKQQLMTTVGPNSAIWDSNPTAVAGSTFASGPGTELTPFNTRMAGADPEEVRQYKLMSAMVAGVPETFLADVSTGNLATATTLDRPTELVFTEKQEDWREILVTIGKYALVVSLQAPSGKLSEAYERGRKGADVKGLKEAHRQAILERWDRDKQVICEGARELDHAGNMRYTKEAKKKKSGVITVMATFPAIREGDLPQIITAITNAMTLQNKGGQVVGIDEKAGNLALMKELGIENAEELIELMYPDKEYDPDRTKEPEPAPINPAPPFSPGGQPQAPGGHPQAAPTQAAPGATQPQHTTEALLHEASLLRRTGQKMLALLGK